MNSRTELELDNTTINSNSKAGIGWKQQKWVDMDVNSVDSTKPIPSLPTLSPKHKQIGEIQNDIHVKALTPKQISLRSKKNGKVCWWWRRGRCYHGSKCWFTHNKDSNDAVRGSRGSINIRRRGRSQLYQEHL